jgi:hypothetical protein
VASLENRSPVASETVRNSKLNETDNICEETMADVSQSAATEQSPPGTAAAHSTAVETSTLISNYVNFCRVNGMPEELIIDFGLTTDPAEMTAGSVIVSERVIFNYYTAKRLLEALQLTISRHEAAFGPLELNVEKRFAPGWRG